MKTIRMTCECGCQFIFEGEATPEKGYKCFRCGRPVKLKNISLDEEGNEVIENEIVIETTKSTTNEKIEKQKIKKEKKVSKIKNKKIKKERKK